MDSRIIKPTIDYVTYIVKLDTLDFWTWYHTEVEGGRLIAKTKYVHTSLNEVIREWIDFGTFGISLLTSAGLPLKENLFHNFTEKHGDHFVYDVGISTFDINNTIKTLKGIPTHDFNRHGTKEKARLRRPDHITYVVTPETMQFWLDYFIALGGAPANLIDDVMSKRSQETSSMMLWTLKFDNFGIALVAGLDRTEVSQATKFAKKHGVTPPQIQHVAYDTWDLAAFLDHLRSFGGRTRGDIFRKIDERGELLQIFGFGYEEGDPAEAAFPEYVQRPDKELGEELPGNVTFSQEAGVKLYHDVQHAMDEGRLEPIIDFSMMPKDWKPTLYTRKKKMGCGCG